MSDNGKIRAHPATKAKATVRTNILKHFGTKEQSGVCYVRSTETWFGLCADCLMWVRDGHASIETAVGLWIGKWTGSSGASTEEIDTTLEEYTSVLRDLFGVEAIQDLDGPYDEAPDHNGRCNPMVFQLMGRQPGGQSVLKLVGDRNDPGSK